MREQKSAGAIIFFQDTQIKYLLLKYSTYWGFAKGMIEENETIEKTAIREIKEGTNLDIKKFIPGFMETQKWIFKANNDLVSKEAIYFLAEVKKEEIEKLKISEEHEEYAWLTFPEAMQKLKIKNNKEMLDKANNFIKEIIRTK